MPGSWNRPGEKSPGLSFRGPEQPGGIPCKGFPTKPSPAGDKSPCRPPCSVNSDRKAGKKEPAPHALLFRAETSCYCPIGCLASRSRRNSSFTAAGAYELDHIGGGTGCVAPGRAGRGLSVRPFHTCSGTLGKRRRSRASRSELPASCGARKSCIARDDQSAAPSGRRTPLALNPIAERDLPFR